MSNETPTVGEARQEIGFPVDWAHGQGHFNFVPELRGAAGLLRLEKMATTDETVGAMLWVMNSTVGQIDWYVQPCVDGKAAASDDPDWAEAVKHADFLQSCLEDMSHSWPDHLEEALTMSWAGFAPCEIVFKKREGDDSQFDDGMWGFDKLPLRDQHTIWDWIVDEKDKREIVAMRQLTVNGPNADIPIWKLLHYRMSRVLNNPWGRALDPETAIPTPDGWRRMDDLQPGDKVFDEEGRVRYVVARADWNDRPSYRVTFNTGAEIVADENHEWLTQNRVERNFRKPGQIRTTKEIAEKVRCDDGIVNHGIAWAEALDYPEQLLPLDPYFLGYWLGDGTARGARITTHVQDVEELVGELAAAGYAATVRQNGVGHGRSVDVRADRDDVAPQTLLRVMGLLQNKHIPAAYLRGSYSQRLALLQGLMDSDGYCHSLGNCEFSNTNAALSSAVQELVRSLGVSAAMSTKINSAGNVAWLVKFTPDFAPFRLARKIARCKMRKARRFHYIEKVEPVEPRRTVCIEVDSPSHLFLAGEAMIPTHNSMLTSAYRPYYLKQRIQESEAIGIDRELCGLPTFRMPMKDIKLAQDKDASGNFTAEARAAQLRIRQAEKAVRNMRFNEVGGLTLPSDVYNDEDGKPSTVKMYDFEIVKSSGQRAIDARTAARDYDRAIARTVLMQFLHLGDRSGGSYAMSNDQSTMAIRSMKWVATKIKSEFNLKAVRLLWLMNALPKRFMPKLEHGALSEDAIQNLGQFVSDMAQGEILFAQDPALKDALWERAGLRASRRKITDAPPRPPVQPQLFPPQNPAAPAPRAATKTRLAKRDLQPNADGQTAKTPFLYDPNFLGSLRPDQVPRFYDMLTSPQNYPTKTVDLGALYATQDRVDPGKVAALQGGAAAGKKAGVVTHNGRDYIVDGHHRLTADWANGARTAEVHHKDISQVSQALKSIVEDYGDSLPPKDDRNKKPKVKPDRDAADAGLASP